MKPKEECVPTVPRLLEQVLILRTGNVCTHLNLQQVVAADALVVHLMVSIIGITAALVLDEGEPARKNQLLWFYL